MSPRYDGLEVRGEDFSRAEPREQNQWWRIGKRGNGVSLAYPLHIFGKWYRSGNGKDKGIINDNGRQLECQLMTIFIAVNAFLRTF